MNDYKIKHLEFIQSNISRMNQCSFQMKGWTITIVSALLALFAATLEDNRSGNVAFIFVAIVPTIIFWFLDSYYLQQEQKFRGIYDDVLGLSLEEKRISVKYFEMPLNKYCCGKYCFLRVLISKTEWSFYLIIIVGLIIAGILLR